VIAEFFLWFFHPVFWKARPPRFFSTLRRSLPLVSPSRNHELTFLPHVSLPRDPPSPGICFLGVPFIPTPNPPDSQFPTDHLRCTLASSRSDAATSSRSNTFIPPCRLSVFNLLFSSFITPPVPPKSFFFFLHAAGPNQETVVPLDDAYFSYFAETFHPLLVINPGS